MVAAYHGAAFCSSEEAVTPACRGRSLGPGNIPAQAGISEASATCRGSLRPELLGKLSVVTELFSESSSVVATSHLRPLSTSRVAGAAEEVNCSLQPQLAGGYLVRQAPWAMGLGGRGCLPSIIPPFSPLTSPGLWLPVR